jgi:hypothetical protein
MPRSLGFAGNLASFAVELPLFLIGLSDHQSWRGLEVFRGTRRSTRHFGLISQVEKLSRIWQLHLLVGDVSHVPVL